MKSFAVLCSGLILPFTLTGAPVVAQEHRHGSQSSATKPAEKTSGHGSMHAMHEDCMQRHQAAMTSIDQLTALMDNAKTSNDPARLKAVIEEAHKQLRDMKDSMSPCSNMMDMMEKMHGAGGMMHDRPRSAP